MQEMQVWSRGQEDTLEQEMATLSFSCLENLMGRKAWWAAGHGSTKEVWHDFLSTLGYFFMIHLRLHGSRF